MPSGAATGSQIQPLCMGKLNLETRPQLSGSYLHYLMYTLVTFPLPCSNEVGVGEAIRESGVPRDELFVVTKVCSMWA